MLQGFVQDGQVSKNMFKKSFLKVRDWDLKWVHMARNEFILRQEEAI